MLLGYPFCAAISRNFSSMQKRLLSFGMMSSPGESFLPGFLVAASEALSYHLGQGHPCGPQTWVRCRACSSLQEEMPWKGTRQTHFGASNSRCNSRSGEVSSLEMPWGLKSPRAGDSLTHTSAMQGSAGCCWKRLRSCPSWVSAWACKHWRMCTEPKLSAQVSQYTAASAVSGTTKAVSLMASPQVCWPG